MSSYPKIKPKQNVNKPIITVTVELITIFSFLLILLLFILHYTFNFVKGKKTFKNFNFTIYKQLQMVYNQNNEPYRLEPLFCDLKCLDMCSLYYET